MSPLENYTTRLKSCEQEVKDCDEKGAKFGLVRGVIFTTLLVTWFVMDWSGALFAVLALLFFVFLTLVHFDDKVKKRQREAEQAVSFYEKGLQRINDDWMGKGEGEDPLPDPDHLFADDLDLFGKGSLFELLNICRTHLGRESLATFLKTTVGQKEVLERQEAVKELKDEVHKREEAARLEEQLGDSKIDSFESWTALPQLFTKGQVIFGLVLGLFALLGVFLLFDPSPLRLTLLFVIAAEVAFGRRLRESIDKLSQSLDRFHSQLKLLIDLLKIYEKEEYSSPRLQKLKAELKTDQGMASAQLEKLDFWVQVMDHCLRNQFVVLLATLFQFNVFILYTIDQWRLANGKRILPWLRALGEFEALTAVAGYAYENPENCFPEIKDKSEMIFDAKDLGHPLLPKDVCVKNDITLDKEIRLLVVSGSNMAGKSTFLRTIGSNAVLAYIGASVRAESLTLSPLACGMTLKIQDSLQDGQSRFYSEIDRIRRIRDLMDGDFPVLFVLDELLSGTNSHERVIGSEALLRQFLQMQSLGLVTTHDLALTELVKTLDQAKNIYLSEKWTDGKPDFEYKVYEGVQKQGNALQWMRALGLDV